MCGCCVLSQSFALCIAGSEPASATAIHVAVGSSHRGRAYSALLSPGFHSPIPALRWDWREEKLGDSVILLLQTLWQQAGRSSVGSWIPTRASNSTKQSPTSAAGTCLCVIQESLFHLALLFFSKGQVKRQLLVTSKRQSME